MYCAFYSNVLVTASLCDREEWTWLQSHVYPTISGSTQNLLSGDDESLMESSGLVEFVRSLRAAVTHLLTKLNIPLYRVRTVSDRSRHNEIQPDVQPLTDFHNTWACFDRRISMACTPGSCCSLETSCPCCCCCLPVRTSAPATGPWWGPRRPGSPCPCRSLSWVGGVHRSSSTAVFFKQC